MVKKAKLYLIPSPIAESTAQHVIPSQVIDSICHITFFLAEDIRTARRYLSSLAIFPTVEALNFSVLDKHTKKSALPELLHPLLQGQDMGVLSESGCPGVADPGSLAVEFAHANDIRVVPLVGPSSIILALMASGFNGQQFAFHGYLPVDGQHLAQSLRQLEKESRVKNQTQIFMEPPHRNRQLLARMLEFLSPHTRLCVAQDITGKQELIRSQTIEKWKAKPANLAKLPCLFLIYVG